MSHFSFCDLGGPESLHFRREGDTAQVPAGRRFQPAVGRPALGAVTNQHRVQGLEGKRQWARPSTRKPAFWEGWARRAAEAYLLHMLMPE